LIVVERRSAGHLFYSAKQLARSHTQTAEKGEKEKRAKQENPSSVLYFAVAAAASRWYVLAWKLCNRLGTRAKQKN
jgi:hypothetical protein